MLARRQRRRPLGRLLSPTTEKFRTTNMAEHMLWTFSRALRQAIEDRETDHIAAILDDDIDWAIFGPIDMFPFLGARQGKEAVIDVVMQIADNFHLNRLDREMAVLGEECASTLVK